MGPFPPPGSEIPEKQASLITHLAGQDAQATSQQPSTLSQVLADGFKLTESLKLAEPTLGMMLTLETFWEREKASPLPTHQRMACELYCMIYPKSAGDTLRQADLAHLNAASHSLLAHQDLKLEDCRKAMRWFNDRLDAIYGVSKTSPS